MAPGRARGLCAALALLGSLGVASAAQAQSAVDEAHATVNRLLIGGGDLNLFSNGTVLEGVYSPIHSVRTAGRCQTQISATRPNHPSIPERYRNGVSSTELAWRAVSNVQASGTRVYYDSIRPNGQRFTYHFQLGSTDDATRAAVAFAVLATACETGARLPPPPPKPDPAEVARVAELNRKADERDKEGRERLERARQAEAEYQRKLQEVAAAANEYERAKAAHAAELAKARAAEEEYQRKKEAHERELASGKYDSSP